MVVAGWWVACGEGVGAVRGVGWEADGRVRMVSWWARGWVGVCQVDGVGHGVKLPITDDIIAISNEALE